MSSLRRQTIQPWSIEQKNPSREFAMHVLIQVHMKNKYTKESNLTVAVYRGSVPPIM